MVTRLPQGRTVFPIRATLREHGGGVAKTAMIRARVEPELKQEAEKVFATLGISPTEAITLFYQQTALHNGLPFELRIPTDETLAAVRQVRSGKGLCPFSSVEEMRADLLKDA